jgi:hypothetical protein
MGNVYKQDARVADAGEGGGAIQPILVPKLNGEPIVALTGVTAEPSSPAPKPKDLGSSLGKLLRQGKVVSQVNSAARNLPRAGEQINV